MANTIFRSIALTSWALFLLSFFGIASADEFHYNNLLIGDRASGMGGAYTAVSDDATGLYYNPSGIVYSSGRNLSASVNAYYNLTKTYKGVIGGLDWVRSSSALLPNYFGIVQPLGKFKFGFSYAVPDSSQEDQDQTFDNPNLNYGGTPVTQYVINFNNMDTTYNVGPSIAAELSNNVSAGLTLYVYQKTREWILNQIITLSDNRYQWFNTYYERSETGIRPILGLMWSPADKLSLGIAVSQVYLFNSETTRQETLVDFAPSTLTRTVGSTHEKRKFPVQVSAGAAYFATRDWLLSADVSYFSEVKNPAFAETNKAVVNAAIGTEYYLSKAWAVRGGLFTNMANTPEIVSGQANQAEEHVNLYGGSLSISNFTRNTSVTLGGSMSYGKGKAQIVSGTGVQDLETLGWTVFLSSTYSY